MDIETLKEELVRNAKGILMIRYGYYPYECFSVCFLHDMLAQIWEALRGGYIPRVELKDRKKGWINWADYFEQPFFEFDREKLDHLPIYETKQRIATPWGEGYGFFRQEEWFSLLCGLYQNWAVLNEKTADYVRREYVKLLDGKRVLGVLCRGTDFSEGKPKGHPVQPDIGELIREAREMKKKLSCDYLYVASEEKRLVDQMKEAFPEKVLENRRSYCDEEYYRMTAGGNDVKIAEVLYQGEETYYQRGLEYISSVMLLSKCKGLVAGDCGGSEFALYMNNRQYEAYHIFSLGTY